ncbi:hypothetical protein DFH06DRAFT_1130903 [Mycena polygramma]|nr:hypothetical protein DFH06DRAFT_1130903 [Mycena polygramma]
MPRSHDARHHLSPVDPSLHSPAVQSPQRIRAGCNVLSGQFGEVMHVLGNPRYAQALPYDDPRLGCCPAQLLQKEWDVDFSLPSDKFSSGLQSAAAKLVLAGSPWQYTLGHYPDLLHVGIRDGDSPDEPIQPIQLLDPFTRDEYEEHTVSVMLQHFRCKLMKSRRLTHTLYLQGPEKGEVFPDAVRRPAIFHGMAAVQQELQGELVWIWVANFGEQILRRKTPQELPPDLPHPVQFLTENLNIHFDLDRDVESIAGELGLSQSTSQIGPSDKREALQIPLAYRYRRDGRPYDVPAKIIAGHRLGDSIKKMMTHLYNTLNPKGIPLSPYHLFFRGIEVDATEKSPAAYVANIQEQNKSLEAEKNHKSSTAAGLHGRSWRQFAVLDPLEAKNVLILPIASLWESSSFQWVFQELVATKFRVLQRLKNFKATTESDIVLVDYPQPGDIRNTRENIAVVRT